MNQPTYNSDGFATVHSVAWMEEPRFKEAYRRALATDHPFGPDLHIEWRIFLPCWAASVAKDLPGDFVDCGVASGMMPSAVCSYIDFNRYPEKKYYLLDTFGDFPMDQFLPEERYVGVDKSVEHLFKDTWSSVLATFAEYPNVVPIRGMVPDTLPLVPSEQIAYLLLDMNAAKPERYAIEYFWDRIVPGGMIVLDDYGFGQHIIQKLVLDDFFSSKGVTVFTMPTAQGLVIKPHR
jgi:hypothetical protein